MAKIETSISIQDGLSQAFDRMSRSIERTTREFEQIQNAVNAGFRNNSINNGSDQLENFNEEAEKTNGIFDKLNKKLLGIGSLIAGAFGVNKILGLSDTLTQTIGRLNLVDDGLKSIDQVQKDIFDSAQRTGTAYTDVANSVASFRQRAGSVFKTNDEAIVFSELLNKSFAIANATQMEAASATLQLTQALGAGALRGEELNAVLEAAPNIVQRIADEMKVPFEQIKDLASDGEITAGIIKKALIGSAEDINTQFESLPFTSGQLWQTFKNEALFAFADVLKGINSVLNGERFTAFIQTAIAYTKQIAIVATHAFNALTAVGAFLYDNWAFISPLLISVGVALGLLATRMAILTVATYAQAAAQWVLNSAMLANPIGLIILIISAFVGLIYLAVAALNKWAGTTISATGVIVGVLLTALAFIGNLFVGLYNGVLDVFEGIYNLGIAVGEFFANVFRDPLGSAVRLFVDFASSVFSIMKSVARAIDAVFGSDLAGGIDSFQDKIKGMAEKKYGEADIKFERFDSGKYQLDRFEYGKAYNSGYDFGSSAIGFNNPLDTAMLGALQNIDSNTGKSAKAAKITQEDLKYLRDAAAAEAINRFTTAEISVEVNNNNNINSALDLDGIMDGFVNATEEAMNTIASGV